MYGSDMLFVENDFGRYSIGSTTDGLKSDADGGLTIVIQSDRPDDDANWLPAPAGPFTLTMRLYGPKTPVLDGALADFLRSSEQTNLRSVRLLATGRVPARGVARR